MRAVLFGLALGLCLSGAAAAQDDYTALLSAETQVTGLSHSAAGFTVVVPMATATGPAYVSRINTAPRRGTVSFTFATPEGRLIETINIAQATIPMAAPDARLEQFATALNAQTLPALMQRFEKGQSEGLRPITIGAYRAVELLGSYTHPQHGPMQWRLVGLLNPDNDACLVALVQVAGAQLPLPSVDSFGQTLTGRVVSSLRFSQ